MKYLHFTDLEGARNIVRSSELWSSFYVKGVFAAAIGGVYSPNVQLGGKGLGRAKNRNVAIMFETDVLPDYCYPEECVWKMDKIPIKVIKITTTKKAIKLLDNSIPTNKKEGPWERLLIPTKENPNPQVLEQVYKLIKLIFEQVKTNID